MYVYDKANELAALIKKSDEYLAYKQLKDEVYADETNKALLKEYKSMQFEAQTAYLTGKEPDAELLEKLKKLGEVLQFNAKVSEFLMAEYRFHTMINDINKIIADACDIGADFLTDN